MSTNTTPPGAPGVVPRWISSAKSGVGKSFNDLIQNRFHVEPGCDG